MMSAKATSICGGCTATLLPLLIVDRSSVVGGRLSTNMEIGFLRGRGTIGDRGRLDLELVDNAVQPSRDDAVVTSIIELGHRLGLSIVAEGVESEATASRLVELECDDLQGFWFARPVPEAQLADALAQIVAP